MEATCTYHNMVQELFLTDIFEVKMMDGKKIIERFGFFAKEDDNYALFRPIKPICDIDESFYDDEEPGDIKILSEAELRKLLDPMMNTIQPIAYLDVDENTPCGWYFDTITREEF